MRSDFTQAILYNYYSVPLGKLNTQLSSPQNNFRCFKQNGNIIPKRPVLTYQNQNKHECHNQHHYAHHFCHRPVSTRLHQIIINIITITPVLIRNARSKVQPKLISPFSTLKLWQLIKASLRINRPTAVIRVIIFQFKNLFPFSPRAIDR